MVDEAEVGLVRAGVRVTPAAQPATVLQLCCSVSLAHAHPGG